MTRISSSLPNAYVQPDPEPPQPSPATTPHAHHRRHRHGVHGHHPAEPQVEEQSHHQEHLARLAKRVRKPRTGKRGGAGSPEEPITDSTFEELLLMLEEHAKKVEPLIIGVSEQNSQHDGEDDPGRDRRSTHGRQALLQRYLQETAEDAAARKPAAAAASTAAGEPAPDLTALDAASGDYKRLETELLAVRHAMLTGHTMPLRMAFDVMRAYLRETPLVNAPATLRAVRERLLATVAPRDANTTPLSDKERTFNQLFPLMLLSASRPRTGRERAEGLARSGAVAKRWTADVWSYRAGLGLAHPPLPDLTV